MSEIIRERLEKSVGKKILVFLLNNFRYEGKLINVDETYFEVLDYKTNSYKTILISEIKDLEVEEENVKQG